MELFLYKGKGNYLVFFFRAQAGGSRAETIPFPFFFFSNDREN